MKKKKNDHCPLQAERKQYEEAYEAELAEPDEGADIEADAAPVSNSGQLVYIPIEQLYPHPNNPRKDLGDLSELADSIKAKGILQNLTVVRRERDMTGEEYKAACEAYRAGPTEEGQRTVNRHVAKDGYTIIIGHRRHSAAKLAGLRELPCAIVEMDEKEQIQTMLLENMQRSDLTVYEQAQGFQMMLDLGSTVEEIAEKSGFSQTTVRRRVKMMKLDQATLKEVSGRQLSLSDFDRLAQVEDSKTRNKLLADIGTFNFESAVTRAIREEHRKKILPDVKKQIKELGLEAIPDGDRYNGKYDKFKHINLDEWKPEDGLGIEETNGVLYHLDHWGCLYFYRKRKKAKLEKKSKVQIEREKAIANAHAALKEEAAVAFELRQKFVQSLSVTKTTLPLLLRGAVIGIVASTVLYKSADRNALIKLYGVDPDGKWDEVRKGAVGAVTAYKDNDLTPTVVYAAFQDSKINSYHGGYSGDWPKYEENYLLDALYAWLTLMGYEMSDSEKALQGGTHELFKEDGK